MLRGLFWFRSDLRLKDNAALSYACKHCDELALVYFYNPNDTSPWKIGSASKWWLHHSLSALHKALNSKQHELQIIIADPSKSLEKICQKNNISHVFWNRLYEPSHIERDKNIKTSLSNNGIKVKSFNASLLYEPWEISKPDGTPYKIFTPFWNKVQKRGLDLKLISPIRDFSNTLKIEAKTKFENSLSKCNLLPNSNWDKQFNHYWQPGEPGAQKQLKKLSKNLRLLEPP